MGKTTFGVIVGRFQTDDLTDGQYMFIHTVIARHGAENVLVFIGDRKTLPTTQNPLPYECRKIIIEGLFPNVRVVRKWDAQDDEEWSKNLDVLVTELVQGESVTLYCGRDGFADRYTTKKYPIEIIDTGIECSATERREEIMTNPHFNDVQFRRGMIYQMGQIGFRNYETVDIAVTRMSHTAPDGEEYGGVEVLMAMRPNESRWRFPGGFVEKGETFADAARRELREETGLWCEHRVEYLGDFIIPDWRIRDAKNEAHRTVLMHTVYGFGTYSPQDDLAGGKVEFLPLRDLLDRLDSDVVPIHRVLVKRLAEYLDIK